MHGGTNPGAPAGNINAWKHGAYSFDFGKIAKSLKGINAI
jgi:hypothetical protein